MVLHDQFKYLFIFLRHEMIFVHIKWHHTQNLIEILSLQFQTNFDHPTYFISNLSLINSFRKLFRSSNNIIIIEIDYKKFISKSFLLKIDKCCHSHVPHLRILTKILHDIHLVCMNTQRDLFILVSQLFDSLTYMSHKNEILQEFSYNYHY